MTLRGIDISSHQGKNGMDTRSVARECDFVVVKATGGTSYVNEYFDEQVDAVQAEGKLLAIYHYAWESHCKGSAAEEAAHFLQRFMPYKGKAIPMLDVENAALDLPTAWYKEWLDIVARETGATPFFYTGAGFANSRDFGSIAKYPLWKASYLSRYAGGGLQSDPVDIWANGSWGQCKMYQYTSEGVVAGYGPLDLDVFYGGVGDWERYCGSTPKQQPGKAVNDAGLKYHVHCQNLGDLPTVHDGQTAGTVGAALRMEGLTFDAIPSGWKIRARVHLQNVGWKTVDVKPGVLIGSKNESRRMEAIGFEVLERPAGDKRKLHFQAHQQNTGWLGETLEGYATGCDGQALRLEAIRVWIA